MRLDAHDVHMKRFILSIFITIIVLLAILVAVGMSLPKEFYLERSVNIAADRETIHTYVGDLEKWKVWTPWESLDPSLEVTVGEQSSGVGASQTWVDQTGGGRLVVTESSPKSGIVYDLHFTDYPKVDASIAYERRSNGSIDVTWIMTGSVPAPIIGGIFATMMESQLSPLLDLGLNNLKEIVEDAHASKMESE